MATYTTMVPQALEEWATVVFNRTYADLREDLIFPQFSKVTSSQRAFEEAWEISGLGTFQAKPEGNPIAYDDPVQGNRTRITMQAFGLGHRITHEMRADDRHDVMVAGMNDLADSAKDHQDRLVHDIINDALAGSSFTGLDGVSLVNTAHTSLKGGGTRSNRLSPDIALSEDGLRAILQLARQQVDDSGRFIPFRPTRLLVPPALMHTAMVVLDTEFRPGGANNDINAVATSRSGITPLVSPYLTAAAAYFVYDPDRTDVRYFDREPVDDQTGTDMDTRDMKHNAMYRAGVGFWHWHAWYGTDGVP